MKMEQATKTTHLSNRYLCFSHITILVNLPLKIFTLILHKIRCEPFQNELREESGIFRVEKENQYHLYIHTD